MIWDLVILTARSPSQRWLFERYVAQLWPPGEGGAPDCMVLEDPPGPQLGTAGATMHALCAAAERFRERLPAARVLILHCGGLSQRVPQLSHLGKAFAPGTRLDEEVPLFGQIVTELSRFFHAMEPGVVIACGDVLFTAPALEPPCRQAEAVAVAYRSSVEQGSRHGVYLWKPGHDRVSEAWQKPPAARLRDLPADQPWGMDTGLLFLGARIVPELLHAVGAACPAVARAAFRRRKREWRGVELYRDLTPPMTLAWDEAQRLPGAPGDVQRVLSRFPLRLACPEPAELRHFGTAEELMRLLGAEENERGGGGARVHASYIAAGQLGPGAVLDRCLAEPPLCVGAGSYVAGLRRSRQELVIAAGRIAYQVPVRMPAGGCRPQTFVAIGMRDDARRRLDEGATLLGQPLAFWLRELGVSTEGVWEGIPPEERTLWNGRLFPVGGEEAVADAVPWLEEAAGRQFSRRVDRWRAHPRVSMAEASRQFDARRWWSHEQQIRAHGFAAALEEAVRRGEGERVGELLRAPGLSEYVRKLARRHLRALGLSAPASLTGARAWVVAAALSSPPAVVLRERGFHCLSRALVKEPDRVAVDLAWQIAPGEAIEAQAPVRVDLAGGWTDTPPQACERGGAVLNLALKLERGRPLMVRVERLAEPGVELVAEDLGLTLLLPGRRSLRRLDPRDPFGIHRGALQLLGLPPTGALREECRRLGGGLRLTTAARVPKGSGLGTSSILGAAVLAALCRAFGLQTSREELCRDVLRLEQLMGTGGGWQDPVGGVWGGAKIARSAPGAEPAPVVEPLLLSPSARQGLADRMVLFYTGEPRLARDVLQRVVGSYLRGDPATLRVLDEMPGLTEQARAALLQGDWERLGRCITRSWELNQQLEPTCSNPALAALFDRIGPFVYGAKLAGAGGGGFLFALARDPAARVRLERLLGRLPSPAKLYAVCLDPEGLTVMP